MELAVVPDRAVTVFAFALAGIALGTLSGLVPGLHANSMALLLAASAPAIPGPPLYVGVTMIAAGVVHTFLDVVPALALGVPDPAMAASALPGHRLVIEGRGPEALRLSALGSATAVLLAVPLAIPMTSAMTTVAPTLYAHLPLALAAVAALLVLTEATLVARVGGVLSLGASGALGVATLDLPMTGPLGSSVLAPLFAGLFGAPVLLDALDGAGLPPQDRASITLPRRSVVGLGVLGSVGGALVGYVPGVSSAIAATVSLLAVPGRHGARGFIVVTSGVNTANAIFALFALVALGSPRTGVLVAVEQANVPLDLPVLLSGVALAAVAGFLLVLLLGDAYLAAIGRVNYAALSVGVLALLVAVSWLFAGGIGVGAFGAAAVVGMLPPRFGNRRAHLMGVLMVPLALA